MFNLISWNNFASPMFSWQLVGKVENDHYKKKTPINKNQLIKSIST